MAENNLSYTKTNWSAGDAITAAKLQKIEDGLEAVTSAVTASGTQSVNEEIADARGGYESIGDRFSGIEAMINAGEDNTNFLELVSRVSSLETEVGTPSNSRIDQLETSVTAEATTRAAAVSALSDSVATLSATVNGFASQESIDNFTEMVASLTSQNTVIEYNVHNLQVEVNDAHRANVASDTLDKRFDDLEAAVASAGSSSAVAALESTVSGLSSAIDALEGTISGLSSAVDTLESTVSGLSSAEAALETRVTAAESYKTVIIPKNCITYDAETGLPTVYTDSGKTTQITIVENTNYLLQGTDDKYYYWKYITSIGWQLISGGGGSGQGGGGTSSAEVYATLALLEAAEKDVNTDYYIPEGTGYYAHYRYTPTTLTSTNELATLRIISNNAYTFDCDSEDIHEEGTYELFSNSLNNGVTYTSSNGDTRIGQFNQPPVTERVITYNIPDVGSFSFNDNINNYITLTKVGNYYTKSEVDTLLSQIHGGESSEFVAALTDITEPDELINYYVGTNATGYTYYKYVAPAQEGEDGVFIPILPKSLLNSASVNEITVTTQDAIGGNAATTETMSGGLSLYNLDGQTDLFADFTALRHVRMKPTYDENNNLTKQELIFTDTNGQETTIEVKGGGGGAAVGYSVLLNNTMGADSFTLPVSDNTVATVSAKPLLYYGNSLDDSGTSFSVSVMYKLSTSNVWQNAPSTVTIPASVANNTQFTIDVTKLLGAAGTTTDVRVTVSVQPDNESEDVYSKYRDYHFSMIECRIEDNNFNMNTVKTGNFQFGYICYGKNLAKTIYFQLDNNTPVTQNLAATNQESQTGSQLIDTTGLTTGTHKLTVYYMAGTVESNRLEYYILYRDINDEDVAMVGVIPVNDTIKDGDALVVNYTVYVPNQDEAEYVLYELYRLNNSEEVIIQSQINQNVSVSQVLQYSPTNYQGIGTVYARISIVRVAQVGDNLEVVSTVASDTAAVTIEEYTNDNFDFTSPVHSYEVLYDYSAYGRTNTDLNKDSYTYTFTNAQNNTYDFSTTFTDFNWASNGYSSNDNALVVNGGATMEVSAPILVNGRNYSPDPSSSTNDNLLMYGRTIIIDYKVNTATDLSKPLITYMQNNIGFKITPSVCYFTGNNAAAQIDADGQFINNEANIAAAYLATDIRNVIAFVIEPLNKDGVGYQRVNIYINGAYANSCSYSSTTQFNVDATTKLVIGDATASVNIYNIKVYNRGLDTNEILQDYKLMPKTLAERLSRFEANDVLDEYGNVSYEKARTKYNCLLLVGPETERVQNTKTTGATTITYYTDVTPTMSPYKGYPSPAGRKNKKGETESKVESGLILTKPNPAITANDGYQVEFELLDTIPEGKSASLGAAGSYCSSNNVQGTSSQKYPVHNLKIYLAKWNGETNKIEKVKYPIKGYSSYAVDGSGNWTYGSALSTKESTLCWKADYMSTDHANTYNANLADTLFSEPPTGADDATWAANKYQNTVNGFRCLLFVKQGDNAPQFIGDGCLNNDKGNNGTYGLTDKNNDIEDSTGVTNYSKKQKWEFTNNSESLGFFKSDKLFEVRNADNPEKRHYAAKDAFECTYPDQGDLKDVGRLPNYNHLQLLLTWVYQRANYWDASDTVDGNTYSYGGQTYDNEKAYRKAIFKNEFEDHFNLHHMLVYYIFSEFIALCDNRVKNMFLRNDDILSEVLLTTGGDTVPLNDVYTATTDPETGDITGYTLTTENANVSLQAAGIIDASGNVDADAIDWTGSTFTTWAPVLYDLDSCYGVENVGKITIRYDADWNYTWENTYQFSGYNSLLWVMFADSFKSEINAQALELYNNKGLTYNNIYNTQIVANENALCAELINQDTILKFVIPWTDGFVDYSTDPPSASKEPYIYLARGPRSTQKSSFVKKRSTLLSSKYEANAYTRDTITFRGDIGQTAANTTITVVPNQLVYPMIMFGDNKEFTLYSGGLAQPGSSCAITASAEFGNSDGIAIAGAHSLTSIGDISKFAPYQINVSNGVNLKELILGSTTITNSKADGISGIEDCPLLETLNIRNFTGLSTLDLSYNGLLKTLYAKGSKASAISLPEGGVLETLELPAATTNLKVLNHHNLTTFSIGDGLTNNYSNLILLWIENTPNIPTLEIFLNTYTHLTGGCRLVGIDWTLGNDPNGVIDILLSEDVKGMYLDNNGTRNESKYPYLSGNIQVNSLRSSELAKLQERYPLLTFNPLPTINYENTIQYMDGTNIIYTDYKLPAEAIIDPVYTGDLAMPTKTADAQYSYKFGEFELTGETIEANETIAENYTYHNFDGWLLSDNTHPTATTKFAYSASPIIIRAKYTNVPRGYKAYWYDLGGQQLLGQLTNKLPYGTLTSAFSAPTNFDKKRQSNGGYYVFTGWDKNVSILTEDINYYSVWEQATVDLTRPITNFASLNAADLYAISCQDGTTRSNLLQYCLNADYTINMGHDFNYSNISGAQELISTPQSFTGNVGNVIEKNIYPLDQNAPFTLVFDYKFLLNSTQYNNMTETVLASCYYNNGTNISGFRLSLVKNGTESPRVKVIWGNGQETTIDYMTLTLVSNSFSKAEGYRNIVVLRHPANSYNLYVYYRNPQGAVVGTVLGSVTTPDPALNYESIVNNNMPLILGGNYDTTLSNVENNPNTRRPASGIIYWAKYWPVDLGATDCRQLAAWPHETMTFRLGGYDDGLVDNSHRLQFDENAKLNFVGLQAVGDRFYDFQTNGFNSGASVYGWNTSKVKTYCNDNLVKALPTKYQSILHTTTIGSTYSDSSVTVLSSSDNYIYLPGVQETSSAPYSSPYNAETNNGKCWPWLTTANVPTIYQRDGDQISVAAATDVVPLVLRFFNKYLKTDANTSIYKMTSDPTGSMMTYNNTTKTVASGDMWIKINSSGAVTDYYMYINSTEKQQMNYDLDAANGTGAWITPIAWSTRTYDISGIGMNNANDTRYLYRINEMGSPTNSTTNYHRGICPEFSV